MDCTFASDNTSGVHPKVMEALNKANVGAAEPYGDDPWTAEAEGCFKALFGDDVDVFLVPLGTGRDPHLRGSTGQFGSRTAGCQNLGQLGLRILQV